MKGKIIFSIGTLTESIRAKRLLSHEGIAVQTVKLEPVKSKKGCAYGIEFKEANLYSVVHILRNNDIDYNAYRL